MTLLSTCRHWRAAICESGIREDMTPEEAKHVYFLNTFGMVFTPLALATAALLFAVTGDAIIASCFTLAGLVFAACIWLNRSRHYALSRVCCVVLPTIIFIGMSAYAANRGIFGQHVGLFPLLMAMCAFVLFPKEEAVPMHLSIAFTFICYVMTMVVFNASFEVERTLSFMLQRLFALELFVVFVIFGYIFRHLWLSAEDKLRLERERAEKLLLNILPAPIAERLKDNQQTIAQGYSGATILFADLVGFTRLAEKVMPEEIVELLSRFFSACDDLTDKHGVEKIKTIGDAYMAVAGLPLPRPDHAPAIARMALDMRDALTEYNRRIGSDLQIRIGIHSGPVVAGVIGKKKFIYDLWGDAVNTAARMESHGVAGKIQVTQASYELLRETFLLEARGTIDVKGKGPMQVYFLEGPLAKTPGR